MTIASGAWGLSSLSPRVNASSDTLYRYCSLTKAFTSLLLHQLASSGRVSLTDRLVTHVPEFSMFDPWEGSDGADITLMHLATHMAGFGRVTPAGVNTSQQALAVFASTGGMTRPAGMAPQYSNPGFATLGHVLAERVMNSSYEAVLTDMMQQLGIADSTGIVYTPDVLARLAPGYVDGIPLPFQDLGFDSPAGGMYGNAANLSAVAQMLAAAAAGEPSPVGLPPALARGMLAPMWIAPDASFQQGAPWEMFITSPVSGSFLVRGKDGGMNGYASYFAFIPELHLSVAMMWNGNIPEIPTNSSFELLVPPLLDALIAAQPLPEPGPSPLDYVGNYAASDIVSSGVVSFNATATVLSFASLNINAFQMSAVPGRNDTFFMLPGVIPCAYWFAGGPYSYVIFERNSAGIVTGFTIPYLYDVAWSKV